MDWGFESLRTHLIDAIVAQLVEHLTCNEDVSGSIPLNGSLRASIAQLAEHVTLNHQVLGSIPSGCIYPFWR
jgi:hypothetical protein